jgi:hypothetical protein
LLPPGGQNGGIPLIIFNSENTNTLVLSPLNNFMSSNMLIVNDNKSFGFGIQGLVEEIPSGFLFETILYQSDFGVNEAIMVYS